MPSGWELHIKLDLYIEIPNGNNEKLKHFDVTLTLGKKNTGTKLQPKGTGIEVEVKPTWCHNQEQLRPQLTSPVQVTTDWPPIVAAQNLMTFIIPFLFLFN